MARDMARAIAWWLSVLLRIPRSEPVAHRDLEHAHWDRARRRWVTHQDEPEPTIARAA